MEDERALLCGSAIAATMAVSALCCLAACDEGSRVDAQRPNEARPAAMENPPSTVGLHMAMRYALTSELRDALILGDLRSVNEIGRELATPLPLEGLPRRTASQVGAVRERAEAIAGASTLADASVAFGSLMSACGECHGASGVRVTIPTSPLPPRPGRRAPGPMRRHEEASIAMWEGLLVGSTQRFDAGARMLADAPLALPEERRPAELRRLADRARAYAIAATRSEGLPGRAEQYGLLLSTCAECHGVARR